MWETVFATPMRQTMESNIALVYIFRKALDFPLGTMCSDGKLGVFLMDSHLINNVKKILDKCASILILSSTLCLWKVLRSIETEFIRLRILNESVMNCAEIMDCLFWNIHKIERLLMTSGWEIMHS